MKLITNDEIFKNTKSLDDVVCECYCCQKLFDTQKKLVLRELKHKKGNVKYCSRSCAAKIGNLNKIKSNETKNKIRKSILVFNEEKTKSTTIYGYICEKCEKEFLSKKIRNERKKTCHSCRHKKTVLNIGDSSVKNILSLSSRTCQKILKRAKIKCAICGWDKTTLDIHHINGKKIEDPHNHKNLVSLCPNCHRLAHENKIEKSKLLEKSLFFLFEDWKFFYNTKTKNIEP